MAYGQTYSHHIFKCSLFKTSFDLITIIINTFFNSSISQVVEVCLVRPGQREEMDRRAILDSLVLMVHLVKTDNLEELDQRDLRENQDSLVYPEGDSQDQRAAMGPQVSQITLSAYYQCISSVD